MQTSLPYNRQSSLSILFTRYLNGDINESAWRRMMSTLDREGISPKERMALARFITEAIDERKPGRLNLPGPEELDELLTDLRATRH